MSVFCFVLFCFSFCQSVLLFGRISIISNDHFDVSFFFFLHGSEAYMQTTFQLGNAGIQNVPILWYDLPNNLSMENKRRYFCLSGM